MTVPNLPTDNLYKFMALFGLTLLIFSQYWHFTTSKYAHDMSTEGYEYEATAEMLIRHRDSLHNFMIYTTNDLEKQNKLPDSLKNRALMSAYKERIKEYQDDIENVTDEFNALTIKNNTLATKIERWGMLTNWPYDFWIMNILGIGLFGSGLVLWYFKYQKYSDAEAKWKGEIYLQLLTNEQAKKKAVEDELKNSESIDETPETKP